MNDTEECEAALRRAFVDRRADYIAITSRREGFQIESASYGQARGWLDMQVIDFDEQSTEWRFRLTEEGRRYFGLTLKGRG